MLEPSGEMDAKGKAEEDEESMSGRENSNVVTPAESMLTLLLISDKPLSGALPPSFDCAESSRSHTVNRPPNR